MLKEKTKRLFIAINIPTIIKDELKNKISPNKGLKNVKWVAAQNYHLTLFFLGDAEVAGVEDLKLYIKVIEGKFGKLEFSIDGIGFFPGRVNPGIIYANCKQTNGNTASILQKTLNRQLSIKMGLPFDKKAWQPHITLGRFKNNEQSNSSLAGLNMPEIKNIKFTAESFELMESILTKEGPDYSIVQSYNL